MATSKAKKKPAPLKWWREARFGMFIHWGLYAAPAGVWKGKDVAGIGEWIMRRAEIPVAEYEQLTAKFNPVQFNAKTWVGIAKKAGMKYIVITAKHHDGFALYDSPCSEYDIVDATPYRKDPMAALARECRKAGIKLCFYYSQWQDWHEPNGASNHWDFDESSKDYGKYIREKVRPQVTELLKQYGPIGLIWFDTPGQITRGQSLSLKRLVHTLQPKALVSGRVGNELGDYGSLGDNQIPGGRVTGDWETPATMNDTWGFKTKDRNWKSVKTLLYLLVDLASKGVNYLLNVGPTKEGIIPKPSVDRLAAIGAWMKVNSEAIYGTGASPYACEFDWGRITQKGSKLYLLVTQWRRKLTLFGLRNKVKKAYLLADKRGKPLEFAQTRDACLDHDALELRLPATKPDKYVSVVVLEIAGKARVDEMPVQQPDRSVCLPSYMAELHTPKTGKRIHLGRTGFIENWRTKSNSVSWTFKVTRPGDFAVKLTTGAVRHAQVHMGKHKVKLTVARQILRGATTAHEKSTSPRAQYFPEIVTKLGKVSLTKPGTYELKLRAEDIDARSRTGLTVVSVDLIPVT